MKKSIGFAVVLWVGIFAISSTVRQCDPFVNTGFSYASHVGPRVFVSHHPLIPAPGTMLTVRLTPDALPAGTTVQKATAFLAKQGDPEQSQECTAAGNFFRCEFPLPAGDSTFVYRGTLSLSDGTGVSTLTSYRFKATASLPADQLVEVRVPVDRTTGFPSGFNDKFRVDTAWIQDPENNYGQAAFIVDVEQDIFEGVLLDPVYRWRDNQLAFYVFTKPAFVSSFYSARDTRCGRNPWPLEPGFPLAIDKMEVLGVLHRKTNSAAGIEGRVIPPVNRTLWRDCAGDAARRPLVGTFSATTAIAESRLIAKHEFGHAAFGFGDEYTEADATRRVAPPPLLDPTCCCLKDSGIGTTGPGGSGSTGPGTGPGVTPLGGGIQMKRCMGPGGVVIESPATGTIGLPTCPTPEAFPLQCAGAPDVECPRLAGDCVIESTWLGSVIPLPDGTKPNVFPSKETCEQGKLDAAAHPGVENPAASLGTCRELCGPNTGPCPCGGSEFWITDLNPQGASTSVPPDAMGSVTTNELHGGTCTWCVETSLCVRWQRSLGNDATAAWTACKQPPKDAAAIEKGLLQLIIAIIRCVAGIVTGIVF